MNVGKGERNVMNRQHRAGAILPAVSASCRPALACAALLVCAVAQAAAPGRSLPPPLPPDQLTVEKLPAPGPRWFHVVDVNFTSMTDARVHLFDGDARRRLGQINAGFAPAVTLSPDGLTTAVATTYFSRGAKGERTDVVEFTDNRTLEPPTEIVLPPKHAQNVPTQYNLNWGSDGRFLFVANITPATSISVVDAQARRFVGEIDTAGCVLAFPAGPRRVASLCESGKALVVDIDDEGRETGRRLSARFFDADRDPIFVSGERTATGMAFVSFAGSVHEADFAATEPAFKASWSFVTDAERRQGWRPGGLQPMAVHRATNRLYVAMHKGRPGSHKDPATEIWVVDLGTKQRVARWKLADRKIDPVHAVQVSQDAGPLLGAITVTSDLVLMDARTGRPRHVEKAVGVTSSLLLTR